MRLPRLLKIMQQVMLIHEKKTGKSNCRQQSADHPVHNSCEDYRCRRVYRTNGIIRAYPSTTIFIQRYCVLKSSSLSFIRLASVLLKAIISEQQNAAELREGMRASFRSLLILSVRHKERQHMRVSLPVIKLGETQEENLGKVISAIEASRDCDFVFFAETTVSGFIPNDNASEMLALGQEIPGEITDCISKACVKNGVWVSIGLLEKEEGRLFDTAIVVNSSGEIVMKYRRLSPGWHWPNSDPEVFCQGESVLSVETPFGKMACLICGDFFDEQKQIEQLARLKPDFLHLLLVRTGGEGVRYLQEDWDNNDIPDYSDRTKSIGIPVLMVNYILDECYGGATILSGDGSVVSSLPIWQEGILKYELSV